MQQGQGTDWSAERYTAFEDERTRPVRDLLAALPVRDARIAVDLGCGPGNSTEALARRLPGAAVTGVDASPDMIAAARRRFMKAHGRVFLVLGVMQWFWYSSDKRRERFVSMCADPDVQRLTWDSYMNKRLVRREPAAHARVFFKDLGHLLGLVRA